MSNTWYVSPTREDTGGEGTLASPWSLRHACAGAMQKILPGDAIILRGGLYRSIAGYRVAVSGTLGRPVTFSAFPGETPLVDGSIPDFLPAGNSAWEPVALSPGHNVYRSVDAFDHRTARYGGFIALDGVLYSLAPHQDISRLQSDTHLRAFPAPHYLGPGLAYDPTTKRLYIRLDNSTPEAQQHRSTVIQIPDADPRNHQIHIGPNDHFALTIVGSHLRFQGIHFRGHYGCWFVQGSPTDLAFHDCAGEPYRFVARLGRATQVNIRGGTYHGHMHSSHWWVAYSDIKGDDEPAIGVRKCAFDLGATSNVELGPSTMTGQRMIIRQFFDGILAHGPLTNINVHGIWFDEMWDDAWQQVANISDVEYHDNIHFGAGPSRDGAVSQWTPDGSIYIHDNVIDTTIHPIFWFRGGRPETPAVREAIPFSGHEVPGPSDPALPWKLYHNTVFTGSVAGHSELGSGPFGRNTTAGQPQHEVYNNIFVVLDGRPLARDFYATSGVEVYDGNCLWSAGQWAAKEGPYRFVHTSAGILGLAPLPGVKSVAALKGSQAYTDSKWYYPPGWENSSIEVDPELDRLYVPTAAAALTGAVDLTTKGWPGVTFYRAQRGAVLTALFPPAPPPDADVTIAPAEESRPAPAADEARAR